MDILAVQQRLIDNGYQFLEHVFNDGGPSNCYVSICLSRNPHAFDSGSGEIRPGWGRFPRMECWQMIAEWLDEHYPPVTNGRSDA